MTNPYESPKLPNVLEPIGAVPGPGQRPGMWKWAVCGLLFLATMMMYMDRQTLATMAERICQELHLSNQQYGQLEMGFGLAFAVGAIVNGLIADRVSIRWFYPIVLIGWSVMGVATAYGVEIGQALLGPIDFIRAGFETDVVGTEWLPPEHPQQRPAFVGLMFCRVLLGFFESGHWPCALITTQRILSANDRTLGNSVLQSGASVGAVLTPLAVWVMLSDVTGSWRGPFVIIGVIGIAWVVPWLLLVNGRDLAKPVTTPEEAARPVAASEPDASIWIRRSLVLLAVVIPINFTWQFFRAWLAKMLQSQHGYTQQEVLGFTSLYFLVADAGCIAAGATVKGMTAGGWHRHAARTLAFTVCTAICLLGVLAAYLPKGWPLLGVLLAVGFGSLGMFPVYYSLTQEMSKKHQGLVSGILGFLTWVTFALAQPPLGKLVDDTKSYNTAILWIVQLPIIACVAMAFFWGRSPKDEAPSSTSA